MAEPVVLHPFPPSAAPDHAIPDAPIDSISFPADLDLDFDLDIFPDLDFDMDFSIEDYLDIPGPSSPPDPPSSEGSVSARATANPDTDPPKPPSAPPEGGVYAAGSPGSGNSATEERTKNRGLKRKKTPGGYPDGTCANPGHAATSNGSKSRRAGASDEAESSSCLFARDEDEKKRLRLMRNRESAQLSRQRKKQYVEELEDKLKAMHSTISDLNTRITYVMAENASLRQQLARAGGKGIMPAYPGVPPMAPVNFPWYPAYPVRVSSSQVPLVPIPKLKPQQSSSKGKKTNGKTKNVAGVSLLGLLFCAMIAGMVVSGGNFGYGNASEGRRNGGILSQRNGRVLTVNEDVGVVDRVVDRGWSGGDHVNEKKLGSRLGESSGSRNASEPLFASLYVPRNDKLVKIDGNLIISSVLAGESAVAQESSEVAGYKATYTSKTVRKETDLAANSGFSSALALVNSGRNSHMFRTVAEKLKTLPAGGSPDVFADKWSSATSDRFPQDWFREGLEGPIFSSSVCTEVFRFDASEQAGIVPTTSVANTSKTTEKSSPAEGKLRNRRILHTPLLGGSASNDSEEVLGISHPQPQDDNFNRTEPSNPMVVSVLVDPREAGDSDNDGRIISKSISRIFVVVLMDSVKYITYSCVLPFKNSGPHLVAR